MDLGKTDIWLLSFVIDSQYIRKSFLLFGWIVDHIIYSTNEEFIDKILVWSTR